MAEKNRRFLCGRCLFYAFFRPCSTHTIFSRRRAARERGQRCVDDVLIDLLDAGDDVVTGLHAERDEVVQPQDARAIRQPLVQEDRILRIRVEEEAL